MYKKSHKKSLLKNYTNKKTIYIYLNRTIYCYQSAYTYLWTYYISELELKIIPIAHRPIHNHTLTVVTFTSLNFRFFYANPYKKRLELHTKQGDRFHYICITSKSHNKDPHKNRPKCIIKILNDCKIISLLISLIRLMWHLQKKKKKKK